MTSPHMPDGGGSPRALLPSPSSSYPIRCRQHFQSKWSKLQLLFGFARQITSAEKGLNDLKAASSSCPSLPSNISSPIRASSPISASPSVLAQLTEGPTNKSPSPH